ncbi:MAG TPA: LacI family DNA-binding transcriptional regulator [Anaerolineaceae bacterium]|nr:LacI family DNA-binding transcriptional regulator [Anaerolineaceae bacterium]
MKAKVTLHDLARQSGVSVATVSLALNDRPGVSAETRARILAAAAELGYPLKPPAPAANGRDLATIGMLVKTDPDISPQANPFYSKVMAGIEDACRRSGANLLFATLPVDEHNRALEAPAMLSSGLVDGLLLVGMCVGENVAVLDLLSKSARRGVPIVLVDGYDEHERFDQVVSDNFHAAYQAVAHLIARGHRRIGLAGGGSDCYPSIRERRNGYLRALKEHGIAETCTADFNINRTHGQAEICELLAAHPELTALFCVNDDAGAAAIKAAQALGRRVPEQLSIFGFDDTYIAANTTPGLTTLHVDTVAMGRAAVQMLNLRMTYPESARMSFLIHPWRVDRGTVGPAPAPSPTNEVTP